MPTGILKPVYLSRKEFDALLGRLLLVLLLGLLVFAPVALGAVYSFGFLVVQGLVVLALLVWGVRLWVSPKPQLLWPPLCWVVLAFMLYAVARYFTTDVEYIARLEVIQVIVLGCFFFALLNNLFRQETTQAILFTLVALGTLMVFLAIYQFTHHNRSVWGVVNYQYIGRAVGTYYSPNNFSCFLELLLPLVLAFILAGRLKVMTRVLLGYGGVMLLTGLVLSLSRGGWLATGIGLITTLLLLATHRHHRGAALILLLLIFGGGIGGGYYYQKHEAQINLVNQFNPAASGLRDWDMRKDMWSAAIRMWRDYPWFGVGPAQYDVHFTAYRPERMQLQPYRVHNDYLNLLVDWGVVGTLIVLAGLVAFVAGLVETWRHVQRSEGDFNSGFSNRFAFFAGASGALAALAVHSVVDFNLHIPANAAVGLTWLALLTSNQRFATERHWVNVQPRLRWVLTVTFLALSVLLVWQGWRRARESFWLADASQQIPNSAEQAACLQRAAEAEPDNYLTWSTLGDIWRLNSLQEPENYVDLGNLALQEYQRSCVLNPYYPYNYLFPGMVLDWLGRSAESGPYFKQAERLDPNGTFVLASIGWHYAQIHDFAAALAWEDRSRRLDFVSNGDGERDYNLINNRLLEEIGSAP